MREPLAEFHINKFIRHVSRLCYLVPDDLLDIRSLFYISAVGFLEN